MTLAITPGEPAGIGPDIALTAAQANSAGLIIVADIEMMRQRADRLGIDVEFCDWNAGAELHPDKLNVASVPVRTAVTPGELDPDNAHYVIETLDLAVSLCESGACAGLVTGPVNKATINDAGIRFSGHTEWLAERTGSPHVVMLLATPGLRVALATTHLPLRDVADAITPDLLEKTIAVIDADLRMKFDIAQPRILVLGLNPHAGESGHLGREELDIIRPTLERVRDRFRVIGPVPADTAFTPRLLDTCDVVLAMYHDQGLPVLKFRGFGRAANITLGLPIVRTSVDHGTALELAGTGRAEPDSLITAIDYARQLAHNRTGRSDARAKTI